MNKMTDDYEDLLFPEEREYLKNPNKAKAELQDLKEQLRLDYYV